jgi:pSer/pThr/pTyr-binding forkhead associated (FHA) protein
VNRVGSDPQSNIVLDTPGVLPQHCQLHVSATGVMLEVPVGTTVSVNGRHVDGLIALRSGDTVTFDHVLARRIEHDIGLRIGAHAVHTGTQQHLRVFATRKNQLHWHAALPRRT